jgi:hypothetical protein
MQPAKINYKIYQGSTFQESYRWESETKVYVPIQAIQKSAPCVISTTVNHNLPLGWRFRVVGAGGMKELNNVGETYYLSTAYSAVAPTLIDVQELEEIYLGQLDIWNEMKIQDAQIVAPTIRPWVNLTPVATYQLIMSSGQQISPPVPSNFAPTLHNLNNSYTTWQNAVTANQATVAAAQAAAANKIEINQVNSLQYTAYTNGGVVEYNQPVPLISYSARMQIRETSDSEDVIYSTTSGPGGHIIIDLELNSITITIPAAVTQTFDFATAVYSLELYEAGGLVVPFLTGNLTLVQEVTR